jgi:hypothetical protein
MNFVMSFIITEEGYMVFFSAADPYVFGPPGSGSGTGSISERYESGSGSFYHQAKIVRKTLISTVL